MTVAVALVMHGCCSGNHGCGGVGAVVAVLLLAWRKINGGRIVFKCFLSQISRSRKRANLVSQGCVKHGKYRIFNQIRFIPKSQNGTALANDKIDLKFEF